MSYMDVKMAEILAIENELYLDGEINPNALPVIQEMAKVFKFKIPNTLADAERLVLGHPY